MEMALLTGILSTRQTGELKTLGSSEAQRMRMEFEERRWKDIGERARYRASRSNKSNHYAAPQRSAH